MNVEYCLVSVQLLPGLHGQLILVTHPRRTAWNSLENNRLCIREDQPLNFFRDLNSCSFVNFYVQQEIEGAHLLDRLRSQDSFNHSHQITQSEKTLITATSMNGKLYLLASLDRRTTSLELKVIIMLVTQNVLFGMHLNWKPKRQIG